MRLRTQVKMNGAPTNKLPRASSQSETVLVVDDHPMVLHSLQLMLRAKGYRVMGAACGEAAIEICRSHPGEIGVVITDLMMPGMDGRAAIQALRALDPRLEFIAVSGGASPEEIAQLEALGIVGFLRKPFSVVEMMEALQKAQAIRRSTA
jgi:CheY-like chemotaxis protein